MIVIPSESKHFKYFTKFDAAGCYLIKEDWKDNGKIISCKMELNRVKKLWNGDVEEGGIDKINKRTKEIRIPFDVSHSLITQFKGRIKDCEKEIWNIRMVKSLNEMKMIRTAEKVCIELSENFEDIIKNKTEKEMGKYIKTQLIDMLDDISFEPIVAYDENSSQPHHTMTNKRCRRLALIDFGGKKNGYCSDVTVMIPLSSKYSTEIEKMSNAWKEIKKIIKPGKHTYDIVLKADEIIRSYYLGHKTMVHALGHSIGMDVHEFPVLKRNKKYNLKIKKGMVFALEPAVYFKTYGIRIEREVYV
ncbi:aminopeptidase P family protein [Candidatus Micrarchaeota archaeon]|nr:aminopeptidase P family protein [Candidatus Micrarchaeota archaeon]